MDSNNQQPSQPLENGHEVKEDEKDEKSPLLPKNSDVKRSQRASTRWVTVEPVMITASVAFGVFIVVSPQYVRARLANARNFSLPEEDSENGTCRSKYQNTSDPYFVLDQKIQADTAFWTMLITSCGFLPALFTAPLLGAWGDIVGRKFVIILPIIGYFIYAAIFLFVIYFNLPLWVVVVGSFIHGVLGNYGLLVAGALAYIADVTTKEKRALRIAIIQALTTTGVGVSQVISGFLIAAAGFAAPLWMAAALNIICILYITVPPFLIETLPFRGQQGSDTYTRIKTTVASLYDLFHENENFRRVKLISSLLALFTAEMIIHGLNNITIIYGLGPPFCWSPSLVGIFSGAVFTSGALGKTK